MRMYDIIEKKRDGGELTDDELRFVVSGASDGGIPDYELTALLMAIYFRGMSARETVTLTDAMAHSGDMLDLSEFGTRSVDKHSTGGVGDKTTLIAAPIAASLGCAVAKMSGRGLGNTGGTVDKLESIPGYRTVMPREEFLDQVRRIGIAVIGQSGDMTPADKRLYALRDVTATVDSTPLIASSVMSKKLAAGGASIVLDVKAGGGAFMKDVQSAETLAREMISIGKSAGRRVSAIISNMNMPLGRCVGNAIEVSEAISVLKGEQHGALLDLSVALAAEMVSLAMNCAPDEARLRVVRAVSSGAAYEKFVEWIENEGGDVHCIDNISLLPRSPISHVVRCGGCGYVAGIDAGAVGRAAMILGAGRRSAGDSIDHGAGVEIHTEPGEYVKKSDAFCTAYTADRSSLPDAEKILRGALSLSDTEPDAEKLIFDTVN